MKAEANIAAPFASDPGRVTIDFTVKTTPGFAAGATISREAAKDLISELTRVLEQIEREESELDK